MKIFRGLAVVALVVAWARAADMKPMGIGLEEVEYPFQVHLKPVVMAGQSARMAYMDVNPGATNAVVLLHGKNFYGAYWEGTIKALTNSGFRVFVPDQIGFGKSSKPDMEYSFTALAEITKNVMASVGIQKFAVVGHSMGGMLAVRMAVDFPERVTHLILANPIGLEDYSEKVPAQTLEKLFQKELADVDAEKLRVFFQKYVVEWKPEVFERYVETRARVTLSGEYPRWAKASARTYQMILQQPVRGEFTKIKSPTLLVIGQKDRTAVGKDLVSEEVAKTMGNYPELGRASAKDIPNARLVEIENAAHIPHLETPEVFQRAVLTFLKGGK